MNKHLQNKESNLDCSNSALTIKSTVVGDMEGNQGTIETMNKWSRAVSAHSGGEYVVALHAYSEIAEISARMYYNMACAYMKLNNTDNAIKCLSSAVDKDNNLVIAFFQRGTLHLQENRALMAVKDLETARALLRDNSHIYYKPLGLQCRLHKCQILHNLALANVGMKRIVVARQLLVEALEDADEIQTQTLQLALERINDTRVDLVPVMSASVDRVFMPPNSIRRNLKKKPLVKQAKVVAASDVENRNPEFDGPKRVEELKLLPELPESTFTAIKRFVKNKTPRTIRSTSDVHGVELHNGMGMSKSTSDLRTEHSSTTSGKETGSPVTRIKRLFQNRSSDTLQVMHIGPESLNSSLGDLTSVTQSPRSQFKGVKKLLKNKSLGSSLGCDKDDDVLSKTVLTMKGCSSTREIQTLSHSLSRSKSEGELLRELSMELSTSLNLQHLTSSYEKLRFNSEITGGYLTFADQTLALSCDVLAVVISSSRSDDDMSPSESPLKHTNDEVFSHITEHENITRVDHNPAQNNSSHRHYINTTQNIKADTHAQSPKVTTQRATRPAKPSYPPPRLPPKSVTT